jgi:nucleoside-diphosphate-sugar epimerase
MDEIVSIVNTIYYYSSTGPELRPNSSLFYIRDFNDTDYWYIDFHHGEYLNQSIARMDKTAIEDMRNGRITLQNVDGPVGVMGRTSDNKLIRELLDWAPADDIEAGLTKTYQWISEQLTKEIK